MELFGTIVELFMVGKFGQPGKGHKVEKKLSSGYVDHIFCHVAGESTDFQNGNKIG